MHCGDGGGGEGVDGRGGFKWAAPSACGSGFVLSKDDNASEEDEVSEPSVNIKMTTSTAITPRACAAATTIGLSRTFVPVRTSFGESEGASLTLSATRAWRRGFLRE